MSDHLSIDTSGGPLRLLKNVFQAHPVASVGFYYFFSDAGHEIAKALGRKRQEDVSLLTERDLLSNNKRSEAEKEGRQTIRN